MGVGPAGAVQAGPTSPGGAPVVLGAPPQVPGGWGSQSLMVSAPQPLLPTNGLDFSRTNSTSAVDTRLVQHPQAHSVRPGAAAETRAVPWGSGVRGRGQRRAGREAVSTPLHLCPIRLIGVRACLSGEVLPPWEPDGDGDGMGTGTGLHW